jgi:uncharacterized membrane protein
MSDRNTETVIAIFDSSAWADAAAKFLKVWEKGEPDIKFASLSLVYETDEGQIKVRNHGPRNILPGIEFGLILGLVVGRATGKTWPLGLVVGALLGAVAGALSWQEPDLSPEELGGLLKDLSGGAAGLVIRLKTGSAERVVGEIEKLDGRIKHYTLTEAGARSLPSPSVAVPA